MLGKYIKKITKKWVWWLSSTLLAVAIQFVVPVFFPTVFEAYKGWIAFGFVFTGLLVSGYLVWKDDFVEDIDIKQLEPKLVLTHVNGSNNSDLEAYMEIEIENSGKKTANDITIKFQLNKKIILNSCNRGESMCRKKDEGQLLAKKILPDTKLVFFHHYTEGIMLSPFHDFLCDVIVFVGDGKVKHSFMIKKNDTNYIIEKKL